MRWTVRYGAASFCNALQKSHELGGSILSLQAAEEFTCLMGDVRLNMQYAIKATA